MSNETETTNEIELAVIGVNPKTRVILFVGTETVETCGITRDMVRDSKALAEFLYQNLPAITFGMMVRECTRKALEKK